MSARHASLRRPPDQYGRLAWLVRTAARNARWIRDEGLARVVEEHELHPVGNAVAAARRARWRRRHGVAPGTARPVFLSGMPRSGTNMLVRGLAALPEVEAWNEGDRAAFDRYRLRDDETVRRLVARSRHRVVLFKPLLDGHRVPALLDGLGTATAPRALWVHRDVDGCIRSALSKFGPAARDALADIAAGGGAWRWQAAGLSPESRALIASVDWTRATPADGVALLWYVKHRLLFEAGLDRRPDVRVVAYAALVADPAEQMAALCAWLRLPWRPAASAHIDRRAGGAREPVALDGRIRALCDELGARLDAAAA